MTHPVPPPEPPPIIQTLPPVSPAFNSLSEFPFNLLSTPDSPVSAPKSAAVLGSPLSVSYPVGLVKKTNIFKGITNTSVKPQRSNRLLSVLRSSKRRKPALGLRAGRVNTKFSAADIKSPQPQPVEFSFQAPAQTKPASPIPVEQKQPVVRPIPALIPSSPPQKPSEQSPPPSTFSIRIVEKK